MTHKTLYEKLRECSDSIDEIQEYVGAAYVVDFQERLAHAIMDVLQEHFELSEIELEVGELTVKSDNSALNTTILAGETLIPVTKIAWTLDAEDMRGKLKLELL